MSSKIIAIQLVLATLLALPHIAVASDKSGAPKNGLDSEQAQAIQAISQAVLTAKHNQTSNSEMGNLRQRVDELYKAVVKLHDRTLLTGKLNALPLENGQSATSDSKSPQDNQKSKTIRAETETDVRQALERVRGQRSLVQQKVKGSAVGEDHSIELNAVAKIQELEDELDKVLQGPPEEQAASLLVLKERLAVKPRSIIKADKEKTPTISTIVHHREQ